jgi:hypothetical protein
MIIRLRPLTACVTEDYEIETMTSSDPFDQECGAVDAAAKVGHNGYVQHHRVLVNIW